jgi:hypothetical protein
MFLWVLFIILVQLLTKGYFFIKNFSICYILNLLYYLLNHNIQVQDHINNILRLTVNRNWTLTTLVNNLRIASGGLEFQSIGIDDCMYSLFRDGNKRVHELGITPNKQIIVYVALNGDAIPSLFVFNELKTKYESDFATGGPSWLVLRSGMGIRGECRNSRCEAYLQKAIRNLGNDQRFDMIVVVERMAHALNALL